MNQQCQHITQNNFTKSLQGRKIFKDQCVRCFREPNHPDGIFVCLKCFNGFCSEHLDQHDAIHNHPLSVRITNVIRENQQKKEITKLAIGIAGGAIGEEEYDTFYHAWCSKCSRAIPEGEARLESQVKSLINSQSPFKKQSLAVWQLQVHACQHSLTLEQQVINKNLEHCCNCALSTNLWLCLTCGNTGCGRKNFDGSGGNNHGIAHFEQTAHPLVVKLGTITAEGEASLYCYACNNDVKDELLASHLQVLGLNVAGQTKTEKTVMQINLDINLNFALNKLIQGKQKQESLYGPGYTGINNIGNTCYMNSVVQMLNSLPEYKNQYYKNGEVHMKGCKKIPGECFYCQIFKIFYGLNSGIYSEKKFKTLFVNDMEVEQEYQQGIKPFDFKILIARDNAEFSSGRQQDALEYLQWLFDRLDKEQPYIGESTTRHFNFQSVNRLVCQGCNGYKMVEVKTNEWKFPVPPPTQQKIDAYYKHLDELDSESKKTKQFQDPQYDIAMSECLDIMKHGDPVVVNCSRCQGEKVFLSRNYFKTTPRYLLAIPNRFILQKWVPKKLNALIDVCQNLNLSEFLIHNAPKVGQKLDGAVVGPKYSAGNVNELINMGFSENAAKRALINSKDNLQGATNWIMQNMDDYSINDPIEQVKSEQKKSVDMSAMSQIMQLGFDETQARIALIKNGNSAQGAIEWLFGIDGNVSEYADVLKSEEQKVVDQKLQQVSYVNYRLKAVIIHLGKAVHSGHYVAYVRDGEGWVLFNDGQVTRSKEPVLGKGYIYVYEGV